MLGYTKCVIPQDDQATRILPRTLPKSLILRCITLPERMLCSVRCTAVLFSFDGWCDHIGLVFFTCRNFQPYPLDPLPLPSRQSIILAPPTFLAYPPVPSRIMFQFGSCHKPLAEAPITLTHHLSLLTVVLVVSYCVVLVATHYSMQKYNSVLQHPWTMALSR